MFKESGISMMLLIAASLVVTVSVYEPAKVGTQPQIQQPAQIQPPPQQLPQTQKQPLQGSQIVGQVKPPSGTGIVNKELQETTQLADRLFPFILQRLDGKTLAQKIDATSLVNKMSNIEMSLLALKSDGKRIAEKVFPYLDAELLAQKVHPHLDLKTTLAYRDGESSETSGSGPSPASKFTYLKADCLPGELAVSGAFSLLNEQPTQYIPSKRSNADGWSFGFYGGGVIANAYAGVNCLKIDLIGPEEPQRLPQQLPAQPPGGPPLRPPTP